MRTRIWKNTDYNGLGGPTCGQPQESGLVVMLMLSESGSGAVEKDCRANFG